MRATAAMAPRRCAHIPASVRRRGGTVAATAAILIWLSACDVDQDTNAYTFVMAGHAYGAHGGTNPGLYPKFISALAREPAAGSAFLVLLGDSVRKSTKAAWRTVARELDRVGIPYYLVLGNHDRSNAGVQFVTNRHGGTFYSFDRESERFIVLDVQRDWGRVTADQVAYLANALRNLDGIKNVFVMLHELIWTQGDARYVGLRHNYGTYEGRFESNYWAEVFPLLKSVTGARLFVVAGDVGGNPGALPAMLEHRDGISYIATGMGEVPEENYLLVSIDDGEPTFTVVPLNEPDERWPLVRFRFEAPN